MKQTILSKLKHTVFQFGLIAFLFSFKSDKPKIIGNKLPSFNGVTLNGLKIDSNYFKNRVTLITFFHVGCAPCLYEINWLKKLQHSKDFQVLYIVSHTAWEVKQFNSDKPNQYSKIRLANKAGKIDYEILPQCREAKSNQPKPLIEPDCNRISQQLMVTVYPTNLLIDKKGIIRQVWYGFGMDSVNTARKIANWQKEIDKLLKRN